jgi:hypothetical protein
MTPTAEELFEQAERARNSGLNQEAINLYHQVRDKAEFNSDLYIRATHMLAVTLKSSGRPGEAVVIFTDLLSHLLPDEIKARITRDSGDCHRMLQMHEDAAKLLIAAQDLFHASGADKAEVAATIGFMARNEFDQGHFGYASILAEMAAKMFKEGNNRQMELFHAPWHGRILAHARRPKEARAVAFTFLAPAREIENQIHARKLVSIHEYAYSPDALEIAWREIEASTHNPAT